MKSHETSWKNQWFFQHLLEPLKIFCGQNNSSSASVVGPEEEREPLGFRTFFIIMMSWWWWHDQPFWEHFQHGFRDARIESASQNPCWNIIHQDVCATKPPLKVLSNRHPCTLYSGIHYGSTSGPNYQNLRRFLVSKTLTKYVWMKYEWTMEEK